MRSHVCVAIFQIIVVAFYLRLNIFITLSFFPPFSLFIPCSSHYVQQHKCSAPAAPLLHTRSLSFGLQFAATIKRMLFFFSRRAEFFLRFSSVFILVLFWFSYTLIHPDRIRLPMYARVYGFGQYRMHTVKSLGQRIYWDSVKKGFFSEKREFSSLGQKSSILGREGSIFRLEFSIGKINFR